MHITAAVLYTCLGLKISTSSLYSGDQSCTVKRSRTRVYSTAKVSLPYLLKALTLKT